MKEKISYRQLLKEPHPTYYLEWNELGSIIKHKLVFHDSHKLKDYILNLEADKNVTYTIMKKK